jgi:hypothetical protein
MNIKFFLEDYDFSKVNKDEAAFFVNRLKVQNRNNILNGYKKKYLHFKEILKNSKDT